MGQPLGTVGLSKRSPVDADLRSEVLPGIMRALDHVTQEARVAALLEVVEDVYLSGREDQRAEAKELFEAFGRGLGPTLQGNRSGGPVLDVPPTRPPSGEGQPSLDLP